MTSLTILTILALGLAAYGAWTLRLERDAARQAARHADRLRAIAEAQRDAARAERDDALDFADEATLLLALDRHPASASRPRLTLVGGE